MKLQSYPHAPLNNIYNYKNLKNADFTTKVLQKENNLNNFGLYPEDIKCKISFGKNSEKQATTLTEEEKEECLRILSKPYMNEYGKSEKRFSNTYGFQTLFPLLKKDNKDSLELLLSATDKDESEKEVARFKDKEIIEIIKHINAANKDCLKTLLDGSHSEYYSLHVRKFNTNEICSILKALNEENSDCLELLLSKTYMTDKGDTKPEFSYEEIYGMLSNTNQKNKASLKLLLNTTGDEKYRKIENGIGVAEILKNSNEETTDSLKLLLDASVTNKKGETVPRFDFTGLSMMKIADVIEVLNEENKDSLKLLLDANIVNKKGETVPRFDLFDIQYLLKLLNKNNSSFLTPLLNANVEDESRKLKLHEISSILEKSDNKDLNRLELLLDTTNPEKNKNRRTRFDFKDVCKIWNELNENNKGYLKELLEETDSCMEEKRYAYTANDICNVLKNIYDNKDSYKQLRNSTIKNADGTIIKRFEGKQIGDLIKALNKENKIYLKQLLGATYKDKDGNELNRFNGHEILHMLNNLNKDNGKYLKQLLDATYKDKDGNTLNRLNGTDIGNILPTLNEKNKEYLEFFLNATTNKEGENAPMFNSKVLAEMLSVKSFQE